MSGNRITKSLIEKLENNAHVEGLQLNIDLLEKLLLQAIYAYYNTDKALLTDKTFDILETILKEKKPNSKIFEKVGAAVENPDDAVKLPYYLGSLDKVKPNEKSLTKWLTKHNKDILISEKLDGLSSLLVISKIVSDDNNTYNYEMKLYKHGDGYEGQDISHLLNNISIGKLDKKQIKKLIVGNADNAGNAGNHIALRGEIIIKNAVYNEKYNKLYPKARSLIAGIVNSKTPDNNIVKDMEIIFYELIYPGNMKFDEQFEKLKQLGFNTAKYKLYKSLIETQLPTIFMQFKQESEYEIDGIVLDDSSVVFPRAIKDNPDYAVAFKMQLDEQIATTTVVNVEYNISKHGTLAPRIEYKPIVIKGDRHQYTTGFNLKYIVDNKIGKDTILKIIKSGDVIPYIYEIVKQSETPQLPDKTIKWHWNDTGVDGIIDDMDTNKDVRIQKLIAFFKGMKIEGVAEGVITKFVNSGYEELKTILELTPDIIASIDGFQLKSATNIYNAIHKIIDKEQPLERVMICSGVFPIGLGEKKFKIIIDNIPNFLKKWMDGEITKQHILNISGFSDKTTDIVFLGMPKFIEWLTLHNMIKINNTSNKQLEQNLQQNLQQNNKYAGMIAVFTGIRNTDLEQKIIEGGGTIGSSITSKTTILIAKNPNENSAKLNKAREQGIEILNITDFQSKYT